MIPVAPGSEPIECTQDEEDLVTAYSILREARHYLAQLDPSPALHADLKGAVRDFCFHYESRIREPHQPTPARSPIPTTEF